MPFTIVLRVLYQVLLERAATLFRPLQPRQCSIYDKHFWSHERYWKMVAKAGNRDLNHATKLSKPPTSANDSGLS